MFNKPNKRGQVGGVMGLILLIILIIGVGIPLANQTIDSANLTGLTATVVGFVPVFLALVVLFGAARFMGN